jgi:hypothetical protein
MDALVAQWYREQKLWSRGEHPDQSGYTVHPARFTDWNGPPPNPDDYMPQFASETCTHSSIGGME